MLGSHYGAAELHQQSPSSIYRLRLRKSVFHRRMHGIVSWSCAIVLHNGACRSWTYLEHQHHRFQTHYMIGATMESFTEPDMITRRPVRAIGAETYLTCSCGKASEGAKPRLLFGICWLQLSRVAVLLHCICACLPFWHIPMAAFTSHPPSAH